ncbi:NUDIX domain-containing protein [Candidatus Woesearchaeota archaeon]|nr:NUDIX domain-containing protein [Candidatus Woesearchaeota archaeon]
MERSAGVVVFRKGNVPKYLLLHYEAGHWDFPKGHVEKAESDMDAAVRECREETGLEGLKFVEGFAERLNYFFSVNRKPVYKEVVYFLAEAGSEKVVISHEHIGFEWLDYAAAMKRITYANSRKVLEKARKVVEVNV